jgi:hypothetical protein
MAPLGVDRRIHTLNVAPPGLAIIRLVGLVPKCDSGDVLRSKKPLEEINDDGL